MDLAGIADTITTGFQGSGCSPFFFTSAIQSVLFGEIGRRNQGEIMETNLEFRQHLQDIRTQYSKERLEDQLLFRRESYELGRQYLIQQTIAQNVSRRKQIEFQDFVDNYWPLKRTAFSVLKEREANLKKKTIIPMTVLIAETEVTGSKFDPAKYEDFCETITELGKSLPNVTIENVPWCKSCQSRISEAMNINYIMGGIPTLILFPYKNGETLGIETAYWSFGRGLQSMSHSKTLQINGVDKETVDKNAISAVKATIGMTRDAYMLAEYHAPIMFPSIVEDKVLDIPELRKQMASHYEEMAKLASAPEFKQLCSREELRAIEDSFNVKLLKA